MIKNSNGYVLISIENDYSPFSNPSTLVFTSVSNLGDVRMQRRFPLSIKAVFFSPKHVVVTNENLVVAIGGNFPASSSAQWPAKWTSPVTGTKRYCTSAREATEVLEIDTQSLQVRAQKVLPDVAVASMKLSDGRLFAAGSFSVECRLEKRVRFAELTPGLELKTIFESNNVNSLDINDFEITSDGIVLLAGRTHTFLPTVLTVAIMSLEQLRNYKGGDPWDESFWEKTEQHAIAFVLALSKDGVVLGDRVFPDLRSRSISTLALENSDRFIAVGSAFGDRGWIVGLRLGDGLKKTLPIPMNSSQQP
jgi:hypothetical protein